MWWFFDISFVYFFGAVYKGKEEQDRISRRNNNLVKKIDNQIEKFG